MAVGSISAGYDFTCALLTGGTVECWGANQFGQLGNGTTTGPDTCNAPDGCSTTPVAVTGLSGVTAISAGYGSACALLMGGTVECWGDNEYGELGNGTTINSATPVAVMGLSGVTAISAGFESACALLTGGTVECWGDNQYDALGNSTADAQTSSSMPVAVTGF